MKKHLIACFALVLVVICLFGSASAAYNTLKSSLYFNNVQYSSTKTSTFDKTTVQLSGRAQKNPGSSTVYWYMKFAGKSTEYLLTNNVVYNKIFTVSTTSNNYGAYNLYPDDGLISGSILCYQ